MPLKLLLVLILAVTLGGQAQIPVKSEDDVKLEKAAVELLRDTSAEVGRLRTIENRISFNAELASLMWFHDEKEAKAMYGSVVLDFKQFLSQLDGEMNAPADLDDEGGFGFFGGYGKSKAERKLRVAMEVRKQIASSLAEHTPDLALNFFYDSLNSISNPEFRKSQEQSDKAFENELLRQIAESDAAKALELGKENIKKGLDLNQIELLKKIYAKDTDKGVEFGAAILNRLKGDPTAELYFYSELLSFGDTSLEDSAKTGGRKPVFERSDMREIADLFAQQLLGGKLPEYLEFSVAGYAERIGKYAPGRTAQLRAKFRKTGGYDTSSNANSGVIAIDTISTAPYNGTGLGNSNSAANRAVEERESRQKAERKLFEDLSSLSGKTLPKDERDKFVEQTRKIIAGTPGREKKLTALSVLAAQVARMGDKALAAEIMQDAERYANPQPRNYQDFMLSWMLASGYAATDSDHAFALLENTILRANDTISAFVKVGEFIDIQEEMISDGEVQVGMFGGSMLRQMTKELGIADSTIRLLTKADFQKTVNLTNTFDRTEIRVLAKMLVLRTVLGPVRDAVDTKDVGG